jgi:hypothetical protein
MHCTVASYQFLVRLPRCFLAGSAWLGGMTASNELFGFESMLLFALT